MLLRHARCVLSRLRCNGHSLLLSSYLSRIGRIENPSCSACGHSFQDTSHLILHCPATDSLRRSLFVCLRLMVQTLGSYPASGAAWSSAMPPSIGRGRVTNNNNSHCHVLSSFFSRKLYYIILSQTPPKAFCVYIYFGYNNKNLLKSLNAKDMTRMAKWPYGPVVISHSYSYQLKPG